jgi:hypothetical protein
VRWQTSAPLLLSQRVLKRSLFDLGINTAYGRNMAFNWLLQLVTQNTFCNLLRVKSRNGCS